MPVVLFVCTANIIRSPIASALFTRKLAAEGLGNWQVASAGTWARDGYPAARESQELLRPMGIDLSRHRSRIVTEGLLKSADLVLTMEQGHKEALRYEFPAFQDRVFLLSEMGGSGLPRSTGSGLPRSTGSGLPRGTGRGMDVRDPVGGTKEDFQETIKDIQQLIDQGFSQIVEWIDSRSTTV